MSTFLFYLLILFLPTQLGRHFWPDFSYVNGMRIDYLAPTVYVTDILIFLLFISNIKNQISKIKNTKQKSKIINSFLLSILNTKYFILLLLLLITVSFFALNPTLSFLKLLKIAEMGFLGWFISHNLGKNIKLPIVIFLLSMTVFYESILAIWQFINQASIGGLWWFLGERTFHAGTPFIAQAVINGQLILRPYGTFPHPNVFGGYLAIVLTLILAVIASPDFVGVLAMTRQKKTLFLVAALILGLIALFLTFSRTAWVAFGLGILGLILLEKRKKPFILIGLISLIGLIGILGFWRFQSLLDVDQKSFFIRQELNNVALKIISDHPLFGVGLNNFLIALPSYLEKTNALRFYQPVHNVFLLIAAETGVVGLLIFLFFIILTIRHLLHTFTKYYILSLLLLELLFLGLFDHYLWTLPQGQLLMAFIFGLSWAKSVKISKLVPYGINK